MSTEPAGSSGATAPLAHGSGLRSASCRPDNRAQQSAPDNRAQHPPPSPAQGSPSEAPAATPSAGAAEAGALSPSGQALAAAELASHQRQCASAQPLPFVQVQNPGVQPQMYLPPSSGLADQWACYASMAMPSQASGFGWPAAPALMDPAWVQSPHGCCAPAFHGWGMGQVQLSLIHISEPTRPY